GRGGGDGLLSFLRGAQLEACVPEGGRRGACLVPGGDLLRAPGGPGFELLGEGGEGGGRRGELFAPCGELLFASGQGLFELDELLQRTGCGRSEERRVGKEVRSRRARKRCNTTK